MLANNLSFIFEVANIYVRRLKSSVRGANRAKVIFYNTYWRKEMPMEKKVKTAEQIAFNKRWGKISKLSPTYKLLRKDVGKAPRCNSSTAKKEVNLTVAVKKKK